MKQMTNYKRVTGYLDKIFNMLNEAYFDGTLPKVVITVQSTPKAYGHFTTYDAWHCQQDGFCASCACVNELRERKVFNLFPKSTI